MYVLIIVIHLLSTVADVIVTDDCCTVKVVGLVVMESNTLNSKLINSILQVITSYVYIASNNDYYYTLTINSG